MTDEKGENASAAVREFLEGLYAMSANETRVGTKTERLAETALSTAEWANVLRAAADAERAEDASILRSTVERILSRRSEGYRKVHVGVLAQARREAWNEGYRAASNDERESMPDHTPNPYGRA